MTKDKIQISVFVTLLLISLVCIIAGTKICYSNDYNIFGANLGRFGYCLFGLVVVIWLHIQEIKEELLYVKDKWHSVRSRRLH